MVSPGFKMPCWVKPAVDHQTIPIPFFRWSFCFGTRCGAVSASCHCVGRLKMSYRINFSSQVTIRLRKGSFWLWKRRADEILKPLRLWFSFNSWETHLSIFLNIANQFLTTWNGCRRYTSFFCILSKSIAMVFSTISLKTSLSTTV